MKNQNSEQIRENKEENKEKVDHNIMVLVGNGFDLAVLSHEAFKDVDSTLTTYNNFYNFIISDSDWNRENVIINKMTQDKQQGEEYWCDFENTISSLLDSNTYTIETLESAVDELQEYFTQFLYEAVKPELLLRLNNFARENRLGIQSLGFFLRDIDNHNLEFLSNMGHYHNLKFTFLNFNFTSLFDNYIYMDKKQFNPHRHKTVDTNFSFCIDSRRYYGGTYYSTRLFTQLIHPHGYQTIPRSMLFGIDLPEYDLGTSLEKRLVKGYWSQYDIKFKPYIDNTELFIIFGMSFGKTDGWWMDCIFERLKNNNAELIIYYYNANDNLTNKEIKEKFLNSCIRNGGNTKENYIAVYKRIEVVSFNDNSTYFLGLENHNVPQIFSNDY